MKIKIRVFRVLGVAMVALLPACGGGHGSGGESTTLRSAAGNPAFPVTMTEPSAGQTFTAPATISLSAVAADSSSVATLEFLEGVIPTRGVPPDPGTWTGGSVVATLTQPPFQATWTDVPAGLYTLVARVTDTLGAQTFSNSVTINVLPPGECPVGWVPIAQVLGAPSAIWFVDADRGWAAGNQATILHTVDGGATWVPQTTGTARGGITKIKFVDADRGWAVGSQGMVLRTTNGGVTWIQSFLETTSTLFDLSFVDSNTGWIVGPGEIVFSTKDGGATWTPLPTHVPGNDINYGVRFVGCLNGWVLGTPGVLHTTDGGLTWTVQLRTESSNVTFQALDFVSTTTGWVSRWSFDFPNLNRILFTNDGGATWTEQTYPASGGILALDFVSPTQGWGVGASGTIIHTEDAGQSWTTQKITGMSTYLPIVDVRFIDACRGWALRADGIVLKTTTGGKAP